MFENIYVFLQDSTDFKGDKITIFVDAKIYNAPYVILVN